MKLEHTPDRGARMSNTDDNLSLATGLWTK